MEEYKYSITKEEINECELAGFEGEIRLVESEDAAQEAIEYLQHSPLIGFDTESKPSFKKGEHHPIALIQLSNLEVAFLFRINKLKEMPDFSKLFSNEQITKIGLGLRDELTELETKIGCECRQFVDLERIAHYHKFHQRGVRALAAFFLKIRVSKSAQKSNWERTELTDSQLKYAATDAWVCLSIFNAMQEQGFLPLPEEEEMFVSLAKEKNTNE